MCFEYWPVAGAIRSKVAKLKLQYDTVLKAKVLTGTTSDTFLTEDMMTACDTEVPGHLLNEVKSLPVEKRVKLIMDAIQSLDEKYIHQILTKLIEHCPDRVKVATGCLQNWDPRTHQM